MLLAFVLFNGFLTSILPSADAYHGIVVDATTNKPLTEVQVLNLSTQAVTRSDIAGRVQVAGAPVRLRFTRIGYASLEVNRGGSSAERPDTIRLLPKAIVLEDVVVRPAKQIRLTAVPVAERRQGIYGKKEAHGLLPNAKLGVLLFPPDTIQTYRINKIVVNIQKMVGFKIKAGRLRLRLVNVVPGPVPRPGTNDLLPVAAIYAANQVEKLPNNELEIDVAAYGLRLPKQGICVVAEGLPTEPDEVFVSATQKGQGKNLVVEVVTATDPANQATYRSTPSQDFFFIGIAPARTNAVTWRTKRSGEWIRTSQVEFSNFSNFNALLDLVVEPEN